MLFRSCGERRGFGSGITERIEVETDDDSIGGHFLHLLHGEPAAESQVRALNASLVLYAEHEFNASTFTARIASSTLSDLYSAVTAAIGTLFFLFRLVMMFVAGADWDVDADVDADVGGDVEDAASLRKAMQGCTGVHLNLSGGADWDLERRGAALVNSPDARAIMEQMFYVSGEIPRVTPYERGLPPHVRLAPDGNSWEPDPLILDERYVAAHVKGKGIVVFTACSHAGAINVLTDARHVFGDVPLYAVMGGFHLSGREVETVISDTIRDFGQFALKRIVPCHCTGWRAVHALASVYQDDVLTPAAVGRQFAF